MEGRTSTKRRVKPGKTLSPRPTKLKAWAYKDFKISELFDVRKGKRLTKADSIPGDINFIGSSALNHGITAKIGNTHHLHPKNTITVTYNGSVGEAFYQTDAFWASDDVNVFYFKGKNNELIALYFCALIRKCGKKYGYSYKWTKELMEQECLSLPVTVSGSIDYAFMQARIQEMEQARIQEMDAYLKTAGFENCELTSEEKCAITSLANKEFMNFSIDSLFDIDTGRDIIIGRVENGDVPLISHQHDNNGISKRIKQLSHRKLFDHKKTIALADRGVFYATTQAEDFHIGTRVKALTFKYGTQKENIRLFFVASINKLQVLFTDYLVNATDKLPSLKLQLPVTSSGEIDYHFMEVYIRAQEKLAIQRVKDWRAKEISTTKEIVGEQNIPIVPFTQNHSSKLYTFEEDNAPSMVAENIFIPGSLEVRLNDTKREELFNGNLDLVLMYAIAPAARQKTESAGRIALGIKENRLSDEAIKAFESVRHIMFHYWKNETAKPYSLLKPTCLVSRENIPEGYLIRQDKDAKQYLLIEYDIDNPTIFGDLDILKAQRKGSNRYMPFVCKTDNIIKNNSYK